MEVPLKQIANWDSPSLAALLENWKAIEAKSVLLIYSELKRRNYEFSNSTNSKIREICRFHNTEDLSPFTETYVKSLGYNDYEEYYQKVVSIQNYILPEKTNISPKAENDKYPALRAISTIYKILAMIIAGISLYLAFYSLDKFQNPLITLGVIVLGTFLTLGLYAISESIMVFVDIEFNTRNKNQ